MSQHMLQLELRSALGCAHPTMTKTQLPQGQLLAAVFSSSCYQQPPLALLLTFGQGDLYFQPPSPKLFRCLQWLVCTAKSFERSCFL